MRVKAATIAAGLGLFRATGLHHAMRAGGCGVILMFHHVRPWVERAFAPNRALEITPDFLDALLARVAQSHDIVSLDEGLARLAAPRGRRFAVLTFDDGYRDFADFAWPVLRRHAAPFTLFVTSGFADGTAQPWWIALEAAIAAQDVITITLGERTHRLAAHTTMAKARTYRTLFPWLRARPAAERDAALRALGGGGFAAAASLCMGWPMLRTLAADPLCALGAHTITHPALTQLSDHEAAHELEASRCRIAAETGVQPRALAYPFGDSAAAGPREFALAASRGFSAALTTRPGLLYPVHAAYRAALPRLAVDGRWATLDAFDVLLSGAPTWVWNGGRRLNVT